MVDQPEWSNPSVLAFAGDDDPIERASAAARQLIDAAIAHGIAAPPIDPLALAKLLGLGTVPADDVADASIAEDRTGIAGGSIDAPLRQFVRSDLPLLIAYNPNRPKGRLRFSIAHEIAHALFPDVSDVVRHRTPVGAIADVSEGDEYELELLCNIVAAELLLPSEAVEGLLDIDTDIDFIMETRRRWDVSTEALLRRLVMSSRRRLTLLAASRVFAARDSSSLKIDYAIRHAGAVGDEEPPPMSLRRGRLLESPNPLATCTAVGQTSRGFLTMGPATWPAQAVGIPGYPGHLFPRVLGLVEPVREQPNPSIRHVLSDLFAFGPGHAPVVLAHIVNDAAHSWSRRGVAAALATRYPQVARAYRAWTIADSDNLRLGNIHAIEQRDGDRTVTVISMVAQHGYGASAVARLRYDALREALGAVADIARRAGATVHVPRFGAGEAGGRWDFIENELTAAVADKGIEVVVHTLPAHPRRPEHRP